MTDTTETPFDYSQPHHMVADCSTGVSTPVLLTDEELAEQAAAAAAWEAAAPARANADILAQITQIESANVLPRPVRDMVLANTASPAYARVKAIDDQIAALRATLGNVS